MRAYEQLRLRVRTLATCFEGTVQHQRAARAERSTGACEQTYCDSPRRDVQHVRGVHKREGARPTAAAAAIAAVRGCSMHQ